MENQFKKIEQLVYNGNRSMEVAHLVDDLNYLDFKNSHPDPDDDDDDFLDFDDV